MTSSGDASSELAEARRRAAELEAVEAERARAAKVQEALYRIAELASAARDLQEFYRAIHAVVGEFIDASNFYLALYDEERRLISWPYYVDEVDTDLPDPNRWEQFGSGDARGTTAYVLRTGQPQHLSGARIEKLAELGEIDLIGDLPADWLGVPLKSDRRPHGRRPRGAVLHGGRSATPSRTRSCSRSSASTSAPRSRERGPSRRRASATLSSR